MMTRQWNSPHHPPAPSKEVQIMNELIIDPEKQAAVLGAVSLRRRPLEADASTLSLASPEMPLLLPPPPLPFFSSPRLA